MESNAKAVDDEYSELHDLQNLEFKLKKNPEGYKQDMVIVIKLYNELFEIIKENPLKRNPRFLEVTSFLTHVSEFYKDDLIFLPESLIQLLDSYGEIMNPSMRLKIVILMIQLRNKSLIPTVT